MNYLTAIEVASKYFLLRRGIALVAIDSDSVSFRDRIFYLSTRSLAE